MTTYERPQNRNTPGMPTFGWSLHKPKPFDNLVCGNLLLKLGLLASMY